MIKYRLEFMTWELYQEFDALARIHYEEMGHDYNGQFEYDPDCEEFLRLERSNQLRFYTVRDDGVLAGYACFAFLQSLQCKRQVQAVCQMIYISKTKRGIGISFILWVEQQLEQEQVDVIYYQVKPHADFSPLLKELKYDLIETVYGRVIKQ